MQTWPAAQVLFSQPVSMQSPCLAPAVAQLRPTAQSRQSPQAGWQAPSSQTRPVARDPGAGSTQWPIRQAWPCGQTTPSQPPTQNRRCRPDRCRRSCRCSADPCSSRRCRRCGRRRTGTRPSSQGWTHTPLVAESAVGQVTPSSTSPSQSLSTPSQTSVAGMTAWRQVVVVPPAAHSVTPPAQIPICARRRCRACRRPCSSAADVEHEVVEVAVVAARWPLDCPVQPFQLAVQVGRSSKAM